MREIGWALGLEPHFKLLCQASSPSAAQGGLEGEVAVPEELDLALDLLTCRQTEDRQ
jgi:hypothetical protein